MTVGNLLDRKGRKVNSIHKDAIVFEAVQLMNEKKIGCLLVMDENDELNGIVSERDVLRSISQTKTNFKGLPVTDIMTPREQLIVARDEDVLVTLMDTMTEKHIRHIPVVDKNGKPQGIISIGDLVKAQLSDKEHEITYLRDYISDVYPR